MGKSKTPDVPEYATAKIDTGGLFGTSTSNKAGTSFKGENWQNTMGETGANLINASLSGLASNDYSQDPNFQVYQDNFNRGVQQAYDTNVLANLNNRGLMRSSGLQSATNSFNNTMQQGLADLYDSYYNRQQNNLSSALNSQNTLYNWITGLNNSAQSNVNQVNNYNQWKYQQDLAKAASEGSSFNNIAGGAINGAMAGSSFGPWGALAGAVIGGAGGAMK